MPPRQKRGQPRADAPGPSGTGASAPPPAQRVKVEDEADPPAQPPPPSLPLDEAMPPAPLPPGTRHVRLLWTDVAGLRRARVVSAARWKGVALAEVCLALETLQDMPAWPDSMGRKPGAAMLVPGAGARVVPHPMPGHAMVACDVVQPGGGGGHVPLSTCPRAALLGVVRALEGARLTARIGFEIEFRLMARDGGPSTAATGPATYALSSNLNPAAPILDDIAAGLEAAGIELQQYHGESGTGAFEVVTGPADPITAVDNLLYTREIIAGAASAHGYGVTFSPKPVAGEAGLGAHVHISVQACKGELSPDPEDTGFGPRGARNGDGEYGPGRFFMAGLVRRLDGMVALTAGSPLSFERRVPGAWAGAHMRWAEEDDKEAPLRFVPPHRFEVKLLDASANPYIAVAALLSVGFHGWDEREYLRQPAPPREDGEETAPGGDWSGSERPRDSYRRAYRADRPPQGARLPETVEAAEAALHRPEVVEALSMIPPRLLALTAAVRRADAATAADMAAGPGGAEAVRAAFNRVYS